VKKALDLMDKFGPVSRIFSRFLPVLNLPSFIAGVNSMKYRRYVAFNLLSAVIWCTVLQTTGYFLGNISLIGAYLDYITDIFITFMAVTIIIAIVLFARDYKNAT
jgi:membrane-associated protein